MRMLSGIVAGQPFTSEMVGDDRSPVVPCNASSVLSPHGSLIESARGQAAAPHHGGSLKAIDYKMPVASAQVKSCLLFAGLFADGETRVEESARTRDHGEVALRAFGAELERKSHRWR